MNTPDIIVIGAGASGLMAAGTAAEQGASVMLLEKMPRPARKLRISGKGRCNITNTATLREFLPHFGKGGNFLKPAFAEFFVPELTAFFERLGVELTVERGGRVFPSGGDAREVVDALVRWVRSSGVRIRTGVAVQRIVVEDGAVTGVTIADSEAGRNTTIAARRVILAAGGASYPRTGSTGDSYRLAEDCGHTIVPVRPALVPLVTAGGCTAELAGLTLRNVRAELRIGGRKRAEEFGELTFTADGLSGPTVLTLSGRAVDALAAGETVEILIDLKPALDHGRLDARLVRECKAHARGTYADILGTLLPRRLVPVFIGLTGVAADTPGSRLTAGERKSLRNLLKAFRFTVSGHRGFDEAIVTAGGVKRTEVDPKTMRSRRVGGLYIAGEALDIAADTGGYNLQAAFSTGRLAGAVRDRGQRPL